MITMFQVLDKAACEGRLRLSAQGYERREVIPVPNRSQRFELTRFELTPCFELTH